MKSKYEMRFKFDEKSPLITVKTKGDLTLAELLDCFKTFAIACGYAPECVDRFIYDSGGIDTEAPSSD